MRRCVAWLAVAMIGTWAGPALAAEDCPPVGHLPTYEAADPPDGRSYNTVAFTLGSRTLTVAGATCLQHYAPGEGTDALGDPEIQETYRQQFRDAGGDILATDEHSTIARLNVAGQEDWVRVTSQETTIDVVVVQRQPHRQVLTAPGPTDDPLLGHMPDYVTDKPDRRAFDQRGFTVRDGDDTREVMVQGARTEVDYTLRDGARLASDADIQENYRTALKAMGAEILFTDERNTVARLTRSGGPVWLKVWSEETAINLTVIEQASHVQTLTPPSPDDYRLLGHMPDYVASDPPQRLDADELTFTVWTDAAGQASEGSDATREVMVQGARTEIAYAPREGANPASDLDIQLNYRTALEALGARILFTDAGTTVARLQQAGRVIWVKIWSQETAIGVSVIEEKPFEPPPPTLARLRRMLDKKGHAAIYPPFGLDDAQLSPDAGGMVGEIAQLMAETPSLALTVEGHTDDIGARDANVALSAMRAQALVAALVARGVAPARLTAVGAGPDGKLDDNATSDGRARNRRMELVKR